MASVCGVQPSPAIQRHHHYRLPARSQIPSMKIAHSPSNFRFKKAIAWQIKERLFVAFASKSDPSSGEFSKDKANEITSDTKRGPPFLTILAGFIVFFIICWVLESAIMWLFGIILQAPRSK